MGDQYYTMETGARKQSTEHRVPLQVVKAVTKRDYPGSSLLDVLEKKEKERALRFLTRLMQYTVYKIRS